LTFTLADERESHRQVGAGGVIEQVARPDLAAGLDEEHDDDSPGRPFGVWE
jgi:hypothetical protein